MLELLNQLEGFSSDERIKVSPERLLLFCILCCLMVFKCSSGFLFESKVSDTGIPIWEEFNAQSGSYYLVYQCL